MGEKIDEQKNPCNLESKQSTGQRADYKQQKLRKLITGIG